MRQAARVTVLLFLFGAGAAMGAYVALWYAKSQVALNEMADVAHFSTYLDIQRSSGTDAAYEEALKAFLLVLEERRNNWSPALPETIYAVDTALTYARLAALARKRGSEQEAERFLAQAAAQCPMMGWRTCTAGDIAAMVAQVDQNGSAGQRALGARE